MDGGPVVEGLVRTTERARAGATETVRFVSANPPNASTTKAVTTSAPEASGTPDQFTAAPAGATPDAGAAPSVPWDGSMDHSKGPEPPTIWSPIERGRPASTVPPGIANAA